jgi:hypothetical protein
MLRLKWLMPIMKKQKNYGLTRDKVWLDWHLVLISSCYTKRRMSWIVLPAYCCHGPLFLDLRTRQPQRRIARIWLNFIKKISRAVPKN